MELKKSNEILPKVAGLTKFSEEMIVLNALKYRAMKVCF